MTKKLIISYKEYCEGREKGFSVSAPQLFQTIFVPFDVFKRIIDGALEVYYRAKVGDKKAKIVIEEDE